MRPGDAMKLRSTSADIPKNCSVSGGKTAGELRFILIIRVSYFQICHSKDAKGEVSIEIIYPDVLISDAGLYPTSETCFIMNSLVFSCLIVTMQLITHYFNN